MNEFLGQEGLKLKQSSIVKKTTINTDTPKMQKKVTQWKINDSKSGSKLGLKRDNSAGEFDDFKNIKLNLHSPSKKGGNEHEIKVYSFPG